MTKDGNGTINAGAVAQFTIVITNNGPGTATGVTLSDDLPGTGWAIFSQTGQACSVDGTGGTLSCSGITLADDASYTVVVRKTTTTADCGNLPNTVTVDAANEADAQGGNNSDQATIVVKCPVVTGQGALDVVKTANPTSVKEPGGLVTLLLHDHQHLQRADRRRQRRPTASSATSTTRAATAASTSPST